MTNKLGRNVCKEIRGDAWLEAVLEVGDEVRDAIWLEVGNEARGEVSKNLNRLTGLVMPF